MIKNHPYIPNSSQGIRQKMLKTIGVSKVEDLWSEVPRDLLYKEELKIPSVFSEMEIRDYFRRLGGENKTFIHGSFAGAGAYYHYVPSVIDPLVSRGEFLTAYTPYQPEISQGTLMAIYEFQTFMANLTGLEISNASAYDGSTAAAEAMLMMNRVNGKNKFLVSEGIHPQVLTVLKTYAEDLEFELIPLPLNKNLSTELPKNISNDVSGVLLQSPNHFGVMEDIQKFANTAHGAEAMLSTIVLNAHSMVLFEPPGALGSDIVAGDCTSFGNFPNFGGPGVGFFTTTKAYVRNLPGRLCGKTLDSEGKESYCLTLSTREQHIRREKATSNICSNQGLCALRTAIYCSVMGDSGLRDVADICYQGARELRDSLKQKSFLVYDGEDFFNEFFVELKNPKKFIESSNDLLPGVPVTDPFNREGLLVAVTEMNRGSVDRLVQSFETWRTNNG